MESQEVSKIVSASQQRQVKSRNFKDKILTLQSHEANQDHKDKENLSALQNRISVLEPLKPEKQHKSSSKDAQSLERFNNEVVSTNVEKVIKKVLRTARRGSASSFEDNSKSGFAENSTATSLLKRRRKKKPMTKYEQIKNRILEEQRVQLEDESDRQQLKNPDPNIPNSTRNEPSHPGEAEDLLAVLKDRNDSLRQTFVANKRSQSDAFAQLEFANPTESKSKGRSQVASQNQKSKNRDFLLINGEKIFFDQSTISSILNVDRMQRLVAYKNKIGNSSFDKSSSGLKI